MCRKCKRGVVKIGSKLGVEMKPPIKTLEQTFCDRIQELLSSEKVVTFFDASVKNGVTGA